MNLKNQKWLFNLPTIIMHWLNGSPVYPDLQVQVGMWFCTLQSVFEPQDPIHGSLHLSDIQDNVEGQSEFTAHSGRQLGGDPMKFTRQEQDGCSPIGLHSEFGPQGDGTQGFIGFGASSGFTESIKFICFLVHWLSINLVKYSNLVVDNI